MIWLVLCGIFLVVLIVAFIVLGVEDDSYQGSYKPKNYKCDKYHIISAKKIEEYL